MDASVELESFEDNGVELRFLAFLDDETVTECFVIDVERLR